MRCERRGHSLILDGNDYGSDVLRSVSDLREREEREVRDASNRRGVGKAKLTSGRRIKATNSLEIPPVFVNPSMEPMRNSAVTPVKPVTTTRRRAA